MKTFAIAEIERFTGIKAHTFRTWEQRFDIFKSRRKTANIRFYTIEDLRFLLDFALLNRFGTKVSHLARLSKQEIRDLVLREKEGAVRQENQINQLIIHLFSLEIEDFELTLDSSVMNWGIDQTIECIILPFLERLKLFSYKGHTGGEYHFAITSLRKKIILGIEKAAPKESLGKSALLFLPKGEHYDLLLLYINYKMKKAGLNVLYLGTNIAPDSLKKVVERKQPHFLITYLPNRRQNNQSDLVDYIPGSDSNTCFVTGAHLTSLLQSVDQKMKYVHYNEVDKEVLSFV